MAPDQHIASVMSAPVGARLLVTDAGVVGIRPARGIISRLSPTVALPFGTMLRAIGRRRGAQLVVSTTINGRTETLDIFPSQAAGLDVEPDRRRREPT